MSPKRTILFLLTGVFCASASHASADTGGAIRWERCSAELERDAGAVARRLECGTVMVPTDWNEAGAPRDVPISVVRVRAGNAVARQGALFMNFGGPALAPGPQLVIVAAQWQATNPADPVAGNKRRLQQQFDLVAVAPRGLDDVSGFDCPELNKRAAADFLLGERTDAHWNTMLAAVNAHADACAAREGATLVNTEQHARDIEHVRTLLGEPRINFYGASYGGWVGAVYGTLFPANVGRMVFDSTVNASSTMENFHLLRPQWRERDLARLGTMPAANAIGFYGLGGSSRDIRRRLQSMPMLLRANWGDVVVNPEDVVAALQVADLYEAEPEATRNYPTLMTRVADHRFHDRIDQTVRKSARALVEAIPHDWRGAFTSVPYGWPAATLATYCNDGRWTSTPEGVRAALGDRSEFGTFDSGGDSLVRLLCARWPRGTAKQPSVPVLATLPPLLMIQNEFDHITPLRGAEYMAGALPNARLIVVNGNAGHGVLAKGDNCATKAMGDYLLTGALPSAARSNCVSGALKEHTPDPTRDEL